MRCKVHQEKNVQEFYRDEKVLITGATGFIGKVLIEALLRKTDVAEIFLLIRPKKGKSTSDRLSELVSNKLFSKVREERPNVFEKLKLISGDVILPGLGLSEKDRTTLINDVTIVFHGAATVLFTTNLKTAVEINVKGTEALLHIAEQMNHLKALMHVSTSFVNYNFNEINEELHRPHDFIELSKLVDSLDYQMAEKVTPAILGSLPNTYILTKHAAELVCAEHHDLPIGIFRPAIVVSCDRDPLPGWTDNTHGPNGLISGMISGVIHTALAKLDATAHLVPVDMTVNCLIASAWDTHNRLKQSSKNSVPLYNFASTENTITWGEFLGKTAEHFYDDPSVFRIWHSFAICTHFVFLHYLCAFFLHFLPGFFLDLAGLATGKNTKIVKMYSQIAKMTLVLKPFSCRQWKINNNNVLSLWDKIDSSDKDLFPFSFRQFDWDNYLKKYIHGLKLHILNGYEDDKRNAKLVRLRYASLHYLALLAITVVFMKICFHL